MRTGEQERTIDRELLLRHSKGEHPSLQPSRAMDVARREVRREKGRLAYHADRLRSHDIVGA